MASTGSTGTFKSGSSASKSSTAGNSPQNAAVPISHPQGEVSTAGKSTQSIVSNNPAVFIAVMGATGSGKSTFINAASNSELRIGEGLQSCTSIVRLVQPFDLNGHRVFLIDTPGFDDTTKSDVDTWRMIAEYLATLREKGRKLSGVIYIHRISDNKMGGGSTRNFKTFGKLCGESALKNVTIVTNMWSRVSEDKGSSRETELRSKDEFFKPVLDKGAQMLRHTNTPASAHAIIARIIDNQPLPLQIQQELVDAKLAFGQTAAGRELNRELEILAQKHQKEMEELLQEIKEAIDKKDEEGKRETEVTKRELEAQMARVESDRQKLLSGHAKVPNVNDNKQAAIRQSTEAAGQNASKSSTPTQNQHTQQEQTSNGVAADRKSDAHSQHQDFSQQPISDINQAVSSPVGQITWTIPGSVANQAPGGFSLNININICPYCTHQPPGHTHVHQSQTSPAAHP